MLESQKTQLIREMRSSSYMLLENGRLLRTAAAELERTEVIHEELRAELDATKNELAKCHEEINRLKGGEEDEEDDCDYCGHGHVCPVWFANWLSGQ